jgi:hypothetical protein
MNSKQSFMDKLSALVGTQYGALLLVLFVHLILFSFLDHHSAIRWLLDASILALVGSAVHAISGHRWLRTFVIVVGASAILLGAVGREMEIDAAFPVGTLAKATLFGVVIVVVFKDVLKRREIDMDAVLGACCIYLLIGLAWESVYAFIEWQTPNSFALPTGTPRSGSGADLRSFQSDLMYFSLITMTTIGYGDITPTSSPARVLSALQGVVAQLYVAIIIARLVGMELANRRDRPSQER